MPLTTETKAEARPTEHVEKRAPAANGEAGAPGEATSRDWAERCANCGAALHGAYCHDCGEKAVTADDYALSAFLRRGLATLTHLDGSAFRTYYSLLARPGFLTQEHRAGRRTRYLRPLQVFLIVNVVFYFFSSWIGLNALQTPLNTHMNASNFFHDQIATRLVEAHLARSGMTLSDYAPIFNRWAVKLSKTLVIAIIPVFALALKALHFFQRRYYVEHLVFALHFWAFVLLLLMAAAPLSIGIVGLLHAVGAPVGSTLDFDAVATAIMSVAIVVYLYVAFRRRYGKPVWLAAAKSIALSWGFVYFILLYRALLFFVAFYATT